MDRKEIDYRSKKMIVFRGDYNIPNGSIVELKIKVPDGSGGYTEQTLVAETLSSDGVLIVRGLSIVEAVGG